MASVNLLAQRLLRQTAVLIRVQATQGSAPREAGAWMAVFEDDALGSVGGGHLEFEATQLARQHLQGRAREAFTRRFALGPSLGQCCGGVVHLRFELLGASDVTRLADLLPERPMPVALFGGGHVGRALIQVLASLPFEVQWTDSRGEIFPAQVPPNVRCEHSDPVQAAVKDLPPNSRVLIMSFSHAEDLDVVAACLQRLRSHDDLPFIGLIGSQTKWATFRHRLSARGFTEDELSRITCPIGVPGITGKAPEVIAVSVTAQLLQLKLPPCQGRSDPTRIGVTPSAAQFHPVRTGRP